MARRRVEEYEDESDDQWDGDDSWDYGDRDSCDDDVTEPCPYCGKEIHEDAERCPYCERYISDEDSHTSRKPWWVIIVAVLLLYLMFRGLVGGW